MPVTTFRFLSSIVWFLVIHQETSAFGVHSPHPVVRWTTLHQRRLSTTRGRQYRLSRASKNHLDADDDVDENSGSSLLWWLQPVLIEGGPAIVLLPLLVAPFLVAPPPTALLLVTIFGILRTLAVQLVIFPTTLDEDIYGIDTESNELQEARLTEVVQVDGVCYGLAGLTSGILAPESWDSFLVPVLGLGTVALAIVKGPLQEITEEEQLTKDEKLLNRWDERLDDSE